MLSGAPEPHLLTIRLAQNNGKRPISCRTQTDTSCMGWQKIENKKLLPGNTKLPVDDYL